MKLLAILILQSILQEIQNKEIHLEKANKLWTIIGQGVKYYSFFRLQNNKTSDKASLITMSDKLISKNSWDLMFKLRFEGTQKDKNDGIGLWQSKTALTNDLENISIKKNKTFGFVQQFSGVYQLIKHDSSKKMTNVYMDSVKNANVDIETLAMPLPDRVNCKVGWDVEHKDFKQKPWLRELTLNLRYKDNKLSLSFLDDALQEAEKCGDIDVKGFKKFYLSMSGYSKNSYQADITGQFFNSDLANDHLSFWKSNTDHHTPELFRKIHYMRAYGSDEDNLVLKQHEVPNKQEFLQKTDTVISQVAKMQHDSVNHMTYSKGFMEMTIGEMELILEYMSNNQKLGKDYYKKLLSEVTKYLSKASKQYDYMTDHIKDLTSKIEKSDVGLHIAKTEVLLENIKNKFGKIKTKMHGLSESTNSIHDNLAKSKKLVQDLNQGLSKKVLNHVVHKDSWDSSKDQKHVDMAKFDDVGKWITNMLIFIIILQVVTLIVVFFLSDSKGNSTTLL